MKNFRLTDAWNHFWFQESGPLGMIAARALVSLNALWIVLSRPDLPEVLAWPDVFWSAVEPVVRFRFFLFHLPMSVERALYAALCAGLLLAASGILPRLTCLGAALLLYHFAPLESIFSVHSGPHFRGLTVPILALLVLAFARQPDFRSSPSGEFRWPLVLIQLEFAFIYLFAAFAKLYSVGWRWISAKNFEGLVLGMSLPESTPPWAHLVVGKPTLEYAGALGGFLFNLIVPAAVLSRRVRWLLFLLPLAHFAIYQVFGVFFLSGPLLLLFVDWDSLVKRLPSTALTRRIRAGNVSRIGSEESHDSEPADSWRRPDSGSGRPKISNPRRRALSPKRGRGPGQRVCLAVRRR